MHTMSTILSIVALVFLAGCQTPSWNKPGATETEFNGDRFACMQSSQQQSSISFFSIYGGSSSSGQTTNEPLFNACMNAKGWSLQTQSATDGQTTQKRTEGAAALKEIEDKGRRICADPVFEPYYSRTACGANKITFEQLVDTSKISPAAKAIFTQLRSAVDAVLAEDFEAQRRHSGTIGAKRADLYLSTSKVQNDRNNLNLYNGVITWGEYNRRRQEIYSEYLAAASKFTSQ